ncbi:glycosyltransferase [Arthrobacter psychrolactophilus]|uniref:Glycosyltransferase n=1 Tax=Arthrobacter psychrolactophilus TaxID=92442 RepID=A0A2V5IUC8_9MICC|nr:glycosyltransferase [Arthrobacter psychrolactophilus]
MVDPPQGEQTNLATDTRKDVVPTVRTALWHLRKGGLSQVRSWAQSKNSSSQIAAPEPAVGATGTWSGSGNARRLEFASTVLNRDLGPRNPQVRAAVILDDFSGLAFGSEWNCTPLSRKTWRHQVEAEDFNLLFVESAWSGYKKEWFGKLDGENHEGSELSDIVAHFAGKGIPTVFWNKEDPVHYGDFLAAARLFDFVYTTDADRIPDYLRDLGHERVGLLPFAAQPRIHNPARPEAGWHERDVAFGGMYFTEKYDSRREQMDLLLGTAARLSPLMENGLEIFSRQLGGAEKYQFPKELNTYVVGSLDYSQMLTAYKAYKVMMNVNTITESSTMCARRVFEILASGTNVISTPSKALSQLFALGEIHICATEDDVAEAVITLTRDPFAGEQGLHLAQRRIWAEHTYQHRCESVLSAVAPHLAGGASPRRVSAVVLVEDSGQIPHVMETLGGQRGVALELVLVTHGFKLNHDEIEGLGQRFPSLAIAVLGTGSRDSRAECLNKAIEVAAGNIVALMDANDHYGPNYLKDQLFALAYSEADVVGKRAHYSLKIKTGQGKWKSRQSEHHWTTEVLGSTITAEIERFRLLPFSNDVQEPEQDFLDRLHNSGGTIYSADRFNYLRLTGKPHAALAADSDGLSLATHTSKIFF